MNTIALSFPRQLLDGLRRRPMVLAAILACVILLLYARVSHHAFLDLDDKEYIYDNAHVRTGLTVDNVIWAFKDVDTFYWHPVTWMSHMLDCQLFGVRPGAHHLVSVTLHIVNALLLFFLLRKATGAVWRSLLVCALFGLHPLNVETVAWLAERKSLLSALFSFLMLAAYGWYAARPGGRRYASVVAAFALALMCKPMAVTMPVLLLLVDEWPLRRYADLPFADRWKRLVIEKLPLLLMSAASSVLTAVGHREAIAPSGAVPLSTRLQNVLFSYGTYIAKIFYPVKLSPLYTPGSHPLPQFILALVMLLAFTVLAVRYRRLGYPLVGFLWFAIALLPVSGIVQVGHVSMADRFTYLPAIGVFMITVWGVGELCERQRVPAVAPVLLSLLVLSGFAAASSRYLSFWRDGVTLFTRAASIAGRPDALIESTLGDSLLTAGREHDALQHYAETCRIRPNLDTCHYNMGLIYLAEHQLQNAFEQFDIVVQVTHSNYVRVLALNRAADASIRLGDYETAARALSYSQQIDPGNAEAQRLLVQLPRR